MLCDAHDCDYNLDGECACLARIRIGPGGQCGRYTPNEEKEDPHAHP